ncbi:hypothetical protein MKC54_18725 [[Clostridium] innocuum]|nr:hypothetical protein [[Clostridium] innocuum]MCR0578932.1 hypothetical protein [[Clostridium] innocuum]
MLSFKKVLRTAILSFLAFAVFAGIFADLLLLMLGLTGEGFDVYRLQICLAILCSVMVTCTYIITRKIYQLSLEFSRWKNKDTKPF